MSKVPAIIAARYLFGKKKHSAVNAIALVALCGVAVATAAIICVLSVLNGFRDVLGEKLDILTTDIIVAPAEGKVFSGGEELLEKISALEGISSAQETLSDQALALYDSKEMPVTLKGVTAPLYRQATRLDSVLIEGSSPLRLPSGNWEDPAPANISIGAAYQLGPVQLGNVVTIFAPKRVGRINPANPLNSFLVDSISVDGVFRAGQSQYDEDWVIMDIDRVRDLLQYEDGESSAIEVTLSPGADPEKAADAIRKAVGPGFLVKDRLAQHEVNFRMVRIEKWVTFLLLIFILMIASFNVISTVSMLVLEKGNTIHTLRAIGMTKRKVGAVFAWESWMVTAGGAILGLALGSILCLLQQEFGFIKLNGDMDSMIISSYPVSLQWQDILVTLLPLTAIGIACAATAAAYARRLTNTPS